MSRNSNLVGKAKKKTTSKSDKRQSKNGMLERHYLILLILILVAGFFLKLYKLDYPSRFYFDEVYHAFTAEEHARGNRSIYDPWAKPPKDVAYEWTHPPLAKHIMSFFVTRYGENPIGWRMSSVILGTGVILLSAIIALIVFKSKPISLLTAFFLSLEGLTYVQSRIAMNDIHFTFFVLLAVYFYSRWREDPNRILPLLATGCAVGFAAATKWTTAYLCLLIAIDLFVIAFVSKKLSERNWFVWFLIAFVVIPIGLYLGSYLHYFSFGYKWGEFVELQKQMFGYHTSLKATHPYSSNALQWILNLKPTWMFVEYAKDGSTANIYNVGNHVILYLGLIAAFWGIYKFFKTKKWEFGFIVLAYFCMWLPWVFSPRIHFFHQYTPAVPFLCMLLARMLWNTEKRKNYLLINTCICAMVCFMLLYPIISGVMLPKSILDTYYFIVPKPT